MKLSEIVEFNPSTPLRRGTVAPFVDMASLPTTERYFRITETREFKGSGSKFRDGDTLLARITPCLENGKGGFVRGLGRGVAAHGSTEFIVLRPKKTSDADFVYYVTRHPDFRSFAIKQMSGTSGRQRVAWQALTDYELVDLTPFERAALGSLLSALDDKIELNRRMNATLEAMARAIFRDWFVDFGPTRAKMQGREPYLAPDLWPLFPALLNDQGIPEGWQMGMLGDVAETNARSWTAKNHPDEVEYVDLSNTKWGTIESTAKLPWEKAPSRARRIARAGDTIIGTTRPGNGSFAYISRDGLTVSTGFAVLTPKRPEFRDFVYIAASDPENIRRLANLADGHGGAYPAVRPAEVSDTPVVVPSDEVVDAFAKAVSPLRARIEFNKTKNETLAQTRDLLLPRLMSGELRVAEAEKIVEGGV